MPGGVLSYAIADPGGPVRHRCRAADSIQPKGNVVVEIQLAETDRLDWALKQFRRRMIRSGLFKDMRRKRFYEKPSEARKAKAKAAERRRHKDRKRARAAGRFGL